jgi:hypothetical protein
MAKTNSTAIKAASTKRTPWNAREVLYSFVSFITQRETPIVCSKDTNSGNVEYLAEMFADENNLPDCRPTYPRMNHPEGVDHITNIPQEVRNGEGTTLVGRIREILRTYDRGTQNEILSNVLHNMATDRKEAVNAAQTKRNEASDEWERELKFAEEFHKITASAGNGSGIAVPPKF